MKFPALKEAEAKLAAKQGELSDLYAAAKNDAGELDHTKIKGFNSGTELAEAVRSLSTELDDLGVKRDEMRDILKGAELADANPEIGEVESGDAAVKGAHRSTKSFGEMFTDSSAYKLKAGSNGPESHIDVDLKTLFATSAGWTPETSRSGLVVLDAQRPVQVTDLIPQIQWGQSAYTYMEETTFTNNAAEASEGGSYGEAALALTERSSTVRKVAVFLPVTDEQLEDEAGASGYIDARLPFMLQQRLDAQILTGNGTPPNLEGINNVSGIQTQAKSTDPVPDAVHKAITKVRVTGRAMPNAIVFHPNDWQDVRLLRTSDGVYIWGNPSETGPERIWGLQVVQSDAQTENTAVVGDFANYSLLAVRRGIDVQVSNSHSTYFVEGKQAIRADMRAALVFTRPAAFATVTGI